MQVKKFEAPTLQEALDIIKRELGPEAIILQTKKYSRGFGLMSKGSVEVTAAVSERSLHKKSYAEARLPEPSLEGVRRMSAEKQAELLAKYDGKLDALRASKAKASAPSRRITATRYVDIDAGERVQAPSRAPSAARAPVDHVSASDHVTLSPRVRAERSPQEAKAETLPSKLRKMSLEEELVHLKRMIEELKTAQDQQLPSSMGARIGMDSLESPALQDAFDQLVLGGVDKRYAFSIVKKIAFELGRDNSKNPDQVADQLAAEIMESSEVLSPLKGIRSRSAPTGAGSAAPDGEKQAGPSIIALVGPTGVGKTTTVAKMASEALLKRSLKVGLINLDNYKVAAFDQLGTYAKILNIPYRSAGNVQELNAALQDFQSLDLILIDTTGRSQRDPGSLKEMEETLHAVPSLRTQLVLSVTTRDSELYDMANRFSVFRPEGLIVSKLDEATLYGAIYNVSQKVKLPLLYFTTGQRVPEDIEEATRERVAALILDI